jgi:hypothetical protein
VLLIAIAGIALLWFTATSAARLREIEGGSRRISSEHLTAGTVIAALLFLEVAVQFAVRTAPQAGGLMALATSLVNGPVLTFAAGVYVLAPGVIGTRAGTALPMFSGVIARLSLLLGAALIVGGGLWLYRDYAWLNDSAFFAFVGWVFVRSVLGTFRWADIDLGGFTPVTVATATRRPAPARAKRSAPPSVDELDDTFQVPSLVRKARSTRKASSGRRSTRSAAKPAARKTPERKTTERTTTERKTSKPKPAARKPAKRVPRKGAPRPTSRPPSAARPEPATAPVEVKDQTDTLDSLLDFDEPET